MSARYQADYTYVEYLVIYLPKYQINILPAAYRSRIRLRLRHI